MVTSETAGFEGGNRGSEKVGDEGMIVGHGTEWTLRVLLTIRRGKI